MGPHQRKSKWYLEAASEANFSKKQQIGKSNFRIKHSHLSWLGQLKLTC
jgi:hypothetical protein